MPPLPFPYPPGAFTGNWDVTLPGNASIGELIVDYAGTPAGTFMRWLCSETSLPVADVGGSGHDLTALTAGALAFSRPTMRSDTTGAALSQSGATDLDAQWGPPFASADGWYALAGLFATDTAVTGAPFMTVSLDLALAINLHTVSSVAQPPRFGLVDAVPALNIVDTYAGGATAGSQVFLALRVSPTGTWKRWVGDSTATGAFPTYAPSSTVRLHVQSNDPTEYKFQEIHVWPREATDAEIEAVRLDLIGL